jgi:hypothetical protein
MTEKNHSKLVPESINQSIEDLKPLAEEFNAESDNLNEVINAVSEKLAALNFGIEVWYHEEGKREDSVGPFDAQLGFARLPKTKRWTLALRRYIPDAAPYEPVWEIWPLTNASRDLRIAGLETVPWFIDEIRRQAQNKLAFIRQARKLGNEGSI